jgi:uncharacterized membrane protein
MSRIADPVADLLRTLIETIDATGERYEALLALVARRREAIRVADLDALDAALREERATTASIAEFDRRRSELAGALARRLGLPTTASASDIAARLPEADGERLRFHAGRLRAAIEACRRESGIVRAAAEALAQHVAGVLASVHAFLATNPTYGRGGRLAGAAPLRTVDLRS